MPHAAPHRPRRPHPALAPRLIALSLIGCLAASGCKLVDQRTFDAGADRKPVLRPSGPPARPVPPPPALATVRFGTPPEQWRPGLQAIVREALARKPEALFRIQTLVPAEGTPQDQAAALAAAGEAGGRQVADAVVEAGASSAQIELVAASDPAVQRSEVRVYVK